MYNIYIYVSLLNIHGIYIYIHTYTGTVDLGKECESTLLLKLQISIVDGPGSLL